MEKQLRELAETWEANARKARFIHSDLVASTFQHCAECLRKLADSRPEPPKWSLQQVRQIWHESLTDNGSLNLIAFTSKLNAALGSVEGQGTSEAGKKRGEG